MGYQVTEEKYEWSIEDYFVQNYFGEYGIHTEWFKGDDFVEYDDVPDHIIAINEGLLEKEGLPV